MATRCAPFIMPALLSEAIGVLPVAQGGTGATTAAGARSNLGITSAAPATATAGETLTAGDVIRFDASGGGTSGRALKAAASSTGLEVVGIVTTGGALGATIEYVLQGAASISFAAAPAATSNGQPVYLSTVAGLGTLTEPTSGAIVRLGFLTGANGADTTPAVWMDTQLIAVLL